MNYKWYKQGNELLNEIRNTVLPRDFFCFWYLGQMGMIGKWGGFTFAIDLVLNDLLDANGKSRRNYSPPFTPSDANFIDLFLCTHNHLDHLNLETLSPMLSSSPNMRVIVPKPVVAFCVESKISEKTLIGANTKENIVMNNGIIISPIASCHDLYKTDENGDDYTLGYHISFGKFQIYHSGDTLLTNRLINDVTERGALDVAFFPINGIDLERINRGIVGNMDARNAAYFCSQIEADLYIPMHYDMVMKNGEDPICFARYMDEYAPEKRFHILKLGERVILHK